MLVKVAELIQQPQTQQPLTNQWKSYLQTGTGESWTPSYVVAPGSMAEHRVDHRRHLSSC